MTSASFTDLGRILVIIPTYNERESLPPIIAGLRISAGAGWQSLIGAELIAANSGIGLMMVRGQGALDTRIVMVGMIAVGVFGMLIDVALRGVEAWVNRKRGR